MHFFSGFSLKDEEYLFEEYIDDSEYCIAGFSYGAIKAFKEVNTKLENLQRVDTLQLFSPAFFQTKDTKFKRLQILSYSKNSSMYLKKFIASCFYPYNQKIVTQVKTTSDELNELLEYVWNVKDFKKILDSGVKVEVYLGQKDCVIDVEGAKEFFLKVADVTFIKDANHFLKIN